MFLALWGSYACGSEMVTDDDVTGVRLSIMSATQGLLHQVEITGRVEQEIVFGPVRSPQEPEPFDNKESVVLLLKQELVGKTVEITVIGFSDTLTAIRTGVARPVVRNRKLVDATATMAEESCGNGICGIGEDFCQCALDCVNATCGDGLCCADKNEDTCTCPQDCGFACGDGCCVLDENFCTCEVDCSRRCGDGCCSAPSEKIDNCPEDCQ